MKGFSFKFHMKNCRRLGLAAREAIKHLYYATMRMQGIPGKYIGKSDLEELAKSWELDNGPADWPRLLTYAAALDDADVVTGPISVPNPVVQEIGEALTAFARKHGVPGTIFTNAALDTRHNRIVASVVFERGNEPIRLEILDREFEAIIGRYSAPDTHRRMIEEICCEARVHAFAVFELKAEPCPSCGSSCCPDPEPTVVKLTPAPSENGRKAG